MQYAGVGYAIVDLDRRSTFELALTGRGCITVPDVVGLNQLVASS